MIKNIFRKVKLFFQRGKNGFCDYDTYSIDYWFLNILPKILQRYIELNYSTIKAHPYFCSYDEWVDILDEMIHYFKEANEETCSMENEYDDIFSKVELGEDNILIEPNEEVYKKWKQRQHEIDTYREECLQKGFDLFREHFHDLWW